MYATVRLCALLSAAALCVATPYYLPQQRQLFYSVVPQYSQYPQYSPVAAPAPVNYRQFYYAPQTAANLVAPVPSALRYPSQLVAPSKQVVYYPGANPYLGNYVLAGDEANEGSGSWTSWLSNIPFASFITGQQPAAPESPSAEGGSAAEGASPAASPEKVELPANSEQPAQPAAEKPEEPAKVKGVPQKYVLVGQPQFFGNFGLQKLNPAAVIPSPENGAVSSYLLLKNFPGVRFAPQVPQVAQFPQFQQVPEQNSDAELVPAVPGAAARDYQKLLQQARQQKDYDDASVTVDAAQKDATPEDDKPAAAADDNKESEDEETGPTIAQAKPKAIALAGPGGVAAAAPVGSALVGPGGMALSAPEATAVAGVKGAGSGAVSPATTKLAAKAIRTYQLANHDLSYLFKL